METAVKSVSMELERAICSAEEQFIWRAVQACTVNLGNTAHKEILMQLF